MNNKIELYIHSNDGKEFKSSNVEEIYFTAKISGDYVILPNSYPVIALLDNSSLFYVENNIRKYLKKTSGLIDFRDNKAVLFLDNFEFEDN